MKKKAKKSVKKSALMKRANSCGWSIAPSCYGVDWLTKIREYVVKGYLAGYRAALRDARKGNKNG